MHAHHPTAAALKIASYDPGDATAPSGWQLLERNTGTGIIVIKAAQNLRTRRRAPLPIQALARPSAFALGEL